MPKILAHSPIIHRILNILLNSPINILLCFRRDYYPMWCFFDWRIFISPSPIFIHKKFFSNMSQSNFCTINPHISIIFTDHWYCYDTFHQQWYTIVNACTFLYVYTCDVLYKTWRNVIVILHNHTLISFFTDQWRFDDMIHQQWYTIVNACILYTYHIHIHTHYSVISVFSTFRFYDYGRVSFLFDLWI